ncbi:MAG TPA: polyprenyl diphosphate synthase [Steroidobacteraceae bacterium]|nr:polyprenyl diphosphate synthase [Steroidobacteraceae bacterium]
MSLHVAIIMDGNGRWAQRRGLPRSAGHVHGAKAVNGIVEAAVRFGIGTLTLYAFSSDNWGRPSLEVDALMRLLQRYLTTETRQCIEQSIRINVIGRRDRLRPSLVRAIEQSERLTAGCSRMQLRIAIDYSSHHSILEAARRAARDDTLSHESFEALLAQVDHSVPAAGAVDLLIRTGGEQRLSDFLLWDCAYAELYFTDSLWPDFGEAELQAALADYGRRQRRFGKVLAAAETG